LTGKYATLQTNDFTYTTLIIIIIIIIIIEFLTSQLLAGKYSPILGCGNPQDYARWSYLLFRRVSYN